MTMIKLIRLRFFLCRRHLVDYFFHITRERSIKFIVVLYVNFKREKSLRKCLKATMREMNKLRVKDQTIDIF
jgi:hypothetical protein